MDEAFEITNLPDLQDPLFIAGFDGWGNAMDISRGMTEYLIKKLKAVPIGKINPDLFYRYDENRPVVDIRDGLLLHLTPPEGAFYTTQPGGKKRDLLFFKGHEPSLRWSSFAENLLSLCRRLGVTTMVSLGGMYDNVLHTETVISGTASSTELLDKLKEQGVTTINYQGPSAIHSTIHAEAKKKGIHCISLWCHCPYYLQGTTHFGMLAKLGKILSVLGNFELETMDLALTWENLAQEIQRIIEKNPELQAMVSDLQKTKVRKPWAGLKKDDKVIHLEDFLKTK